MKKLILIAAIVSAFAFRAAAQKVPLVDQLKQVSQLPAEIPQRVTAMAFDGEKIWLAIYLDKGRYVTYQPEMQKWNFEQDAELRASIRKVTGRYASAGGMVFAGKNLWLGSSYGESFGYIYTEDWRANTVFSRKYIENKPNSQSYADLAFDGRHIWMAWHLFDCFDLPDSQVQRLVKVDSETGEFLAEYALPTGTRNDGTHGLTWDGENLWHIKDKKLSAINSANGNVIAQYNLIGLKRPSGLAWDGSKLWIVEFDGKIWNLPLVKFEGKAF